MLHLIFHKLEETLLKPDNVSTKCYFVFTMIKIKTYYAPKLCSLIQVNVYSIIKLNALCIS